MIKRSRLGASYQVPEKCSDIAEATLQAWLRALGAKAQQNHIAVRYCLAEINYCVFLALLPRLVGAIEPLAGLFGQFVEICLPGRLLPCHTSSIQAAGGQQSYSKHCPSQQYLAEGLWASCCTSSLWSKVSCSELLWSVLSKAALATSACLLPDFCSLRRSLHGLGAIRGVWPAVSSSFYLLQARARGLQRQLGCAAWTSGVPQMLPLLF